MQDWQDPESSTFELENDLTEQKRVELTLRALLKFEDMIARISSSFINLEPEQVDEGIQRALETLGKSYHLARVYVVEFSADRTRMDCTYEWCAEGFEPQIGKLKSIPADSFHWTVERILRSEVVQIEEVADLPLDAQAERAEFRALGVRARIVVPMVYQGVPVGLVGFDTTRPLNWAEQSLKLQVIGDIFVNALEHKRTQEALQRAYQTMEQRVEERTKELAALNAIANMISRSLDLGAIMGDALDKTMEVIGAQAGAAYRLEDATQTFALVAQRGLPDPAVQVSNCNPLAMAYAGNTLRQSTPTIWHVATDYPAGMLRESMQSAGLSTMIGFPLVAKDRQVGCLALCTRGERSLAPGEAGLLMAIGQQVGVAIENARLREQAEQAAAMEERGRLARDLHDSVAQSLYSVTLYAEAAARVLTAGQPDQAAEHLRALRDTAQEALREMRLLIFELRPPTLEKTTLAEALQMRLKAVENRGGIQVEFHATGAERLPLAARQELYQVAQEALNNVLRHAHAQHVAVSLQFGEDAIELTIRDDGVGFETEAVHERGGMGLKGIKERTERIGGTLYLESTVGKGTQITVQVPAVVVAQVAGGRP